MSTENQFDVVYIGSGPGGYVGAIRAAQLGLKTAIIEKDKSFGGTCLNVGCIPSKALLESSEHYVNAKHDFESHGIQLGSVSLDLQKMLDRKNKIVQQLTQSIQFLFKKNKITSFKGTGTFVSATEIEITAEDGTKTNITTKNVVIATGSEVNQLPGVPFDGKKIVSSTEALSLPKVPEKMIVVGGGYIGLELGSVWLRLGSQVTVVEYAPKICGTMDTQVSTELQKILTKQGMDFRLQAKMTHIVPHGEQVAVTFEMVASGTSETLIADIVLIAAGRRPYTKNLGLEKIGIQLDARGYIPVDSHLRTTVPNIYAIGDVIPGPMLAHKAEEEGVAAAETIAGGAGHVNYETVPGVIYTWPEVASVGLSEEQAKERGLQYKVGQFPFMANGRARALGYTQGFAKVIAEAKTDRLLGVHIIGPRASEMIAEAIVVMEFAGSSEDLARSFHAHPTLSEVLREAALNVDQRARQM